MRALLDVGGRKLPVLLRLVDALEKPLLLLILRDVEKELEDQRAVACEIAVLRANVAVAVIPDALA
jgi:hypothetical protein